MVDALLNAAHSEDSEYLDDEHDNVPQITQTTQAQIRVCEFCGSSNTPTWRRGPGGKGSLCNACGIKWRLRKRTKKGDQAGSPEKKIKTSKGATTKRRKKETSDDGESDPMSALRKPIVFKEKANEHIDDKDNNRKNYYCKYCNKTWDFTHFKNSQQFGAHCSNCSRRPRHEDSSHAGLYYKESAPTNLILILRYLQDELSDYEEDTITPPSPCVLPSPTSASLPTVPTLPLPIPPFPTPRTSTPLPSTTSTNPLHTLRLAANECWHTAAVG